MTNVTVFPLQTEEVRLRRIEGERYIRHEDYRREVGRANRATLRHRRRGDRMENVARDLQAQNYWFEAAAYFLGFSCFTLLWGVLELAGVLPW